MYDYMIKEMAEKVAERIKQTAPDLADRGNFFGVIARETLEEYWKDKIAHVWNISNVHRAANMVGRVLSNKEARNVMDAVMHDLSDEYGITLDTISNEIDYNEHGRWITEDENKDFESCDATITAELAAEIAKGG